MIRTSLAVLLVLIGCVRIVHAQDAIDELEKRIDSLYAVKEDLDARLTAIIGELERLEAELQQHTLIERTKAQGIVVTNLEASLRSQPSPGAPVIRTIPKNTVLEAVEYSGAYWKVRYENVEGWVMKLFVNEGEGTDRIKNRPAATGRTSDDESISSGEREKDRTGKTFLITNFDLLTNTAGGISIFYAFENLDTTRTIRDLAFSITPYNEEGNIERGQNSGVSTRRLRRFGPVSVYDGEQRFQFANIWYNSDIKCAQLDRVEIAYTDGSRETFSRNIDRILASHIKADCRTSAADRRDPETVP